MTLTEKLKQLVIYPILCWLGRHAPYTHEDGHDFLEGRKVYCERCLREKLLCNY